MTRYLDFEEYSGATIDGTNFDLLIVGAGAAGLTIAQELSAQGLRLLIIESGRSENTSDRAASKGHVAVSKDARRCRGVDRTTPYTGRTRIPSSDALAGNVERRVFGGSTVPCAGVVAQFDATDFSHREWVPHSGWPLTLDAVAPHIVRAAGHLGINPLLTDDRFRISGRPTTPAEFDRLSSFSAYFWQIARSPDEMKGALRSGDEFRRKDHEGVTVLANATASALKYDNGNVAGVQIISSLSGNKHLFISAGYVVLAAGAVENARLLLLSRDNTCVNPGDRRDVVGRYLMDHSRATLGLFSGPSLDRTASMFGFFKLNAQHRTFIYSHGLSLDASVQQQRGLTKMAILANARHSPDDPIQALKRHIARDPARKIEQLSLDVICEQPPTPANRVTLSAHCDRLGLPMSEVIWHASDQLRHGIQTLGQLLADEFKLAGIDGFRLSPNVAAGDAAKIELHSMGQESGTTRMGWDVASSVVDPDCQVHGVRGLYLAGSSVFPTNGHVDPTMMAIALSIRLADHLRERFASQRLAEIGNGIARHDNGALVLVTGATGDLGSAIVDQLLEKGYRVRGTFHRKLPDDSRVEWVRADFSKLDLVDAHLDGLLTGVSAVIHLAASRPGTPAIHVTNEVNLERLVRACVRRGIRYLGHASSMVVYGSPTKRLVTESHPLIDLSLPLERQYFEDGVMREYARSKREGENVLSKYAQHMHVDVYRIALAKRPVYINECLAWGHARRFVGTYRNSHYISTHNVARAVGHLLEISLNGRKTIGIDAFNIADTASPTYKDLFRRAGRESLFHVPLVFDLIKGLAMGKCISRRLPMGFCRLDNSKLRSTGFEVERDWDSSLRLRSRRRRERVFGRSR